MDKNIYNKSEAEFNFPLITKRIRTRGLLSQGLIKYIQRHKLCETVTHFAKLHCGTAKHLQWCKRCWCFAAWLYLLISIGHWTYKVVDKWAVATVVLEHECMYHISWKCYSLCLETFHLKPRVNIVVVLAEDAGTQQSYCNVTVIRPLATTCLS